MNGSPAGAPVLNCSGTLNLMSDTHLSPLLEILACPECRDLGTLTLRNVPSEHTPVWQAALKEEQPLTRELECHACSRTYPVTHDGIPVLWSDTLRETFTTLDQAIDESCPSERDVKAANIHVYQTIVADYDKAGVHADAVTRDRFRNALQLAGNEVRGWHVDIGCGGGNVLDMCVEERLRPKVGVDVSLSALRVVRRKGYFAVLGDAEQLPFRTSTVALVTASSVLHHLFTPRRLIAEAQRILKRNGAFFSDFDPNQEAADWGWTARMLYRLRLPLYRLLARWNPKKIGHESRAVQIWNRVAEFHNHPGAGFAPAELAGELERAGLDVVLVLRHTTRERQVSETLFVRPGLRAVCSQLLSFKNPFLRKNADTLLTVSRKPCIEAAAENEPLRIAG